MELIIVIVSLAFMLSVIDENFRIGMYLIIAVALLLFGYSYIQSSKSRPEQLQERGDESDYANYAAYTGSSGGGGLGGGGGRK
jgi:membrane protein implicated in regulation of membrane protease activity